MPTNEGYNGTWTGQQIDDAIRKIRDLTVPTDLSQLQEDAGHRTVSESQINAWNAKVDKTYVDGLVGKINTMLDMINGEVV